MRIQHCCIDTSVVETRCDQQLRRYLLLRDATLFLGRGTRPVTVNVVVTGLDCDHFGPLLRAGRVVEADVEIADGCYRLVDVRRRQHVDEREDARRAAVRVARDRVAAARAQADEAIHRAQRA